MSFDPFFRPSSVVLWHEFSGDPWGPCSRCSHPAYHSIHDFELAEETRAQEAARAREWFGDGGDYAEAYDGEAEDAARSASGPGEDRG